MSHFSGPDHAKGGILFLEQTRHTWMTGRCLTNFDSRRRPRNLAGFVQERVKASPVSNHLQLNSRSVKEVSTT
jgi:hypothetical protein